MIGRLSGGDKDRKLMPSATKTQFRGLMRFGRAVSDGLCDEDGGPLQKRGRKAPAMKDSPEPEA